MKRHGFVLTLFLTALIGLIGWNTPLVSAEQPGRPATAAITTASPVTSPANSAAQDASPETLKRIYSEVSPSVVMILVVEGNGSQTAPYGRSYRFGPRGPRLQQGQGSGFVWDTNGTIVTNNHVVAGATRITVAFSDGTTVQGRVVGTDPDSDLAVIKVDVPARQLHPVKLADSTQLEVGQLAIAIGSPFGEQNKMTTGSVTGLGRTLPVSDGMIRRSGYSSYVIPDLIQTDAPINPGSSGGVLLDEQGQVIGVTNAIESRWGTWAGIGFAIPSASVEKVVPELIRSGDYAHPWLGLSGTSLDAALAREMGLSAQQRGVLIAEVVPGSPAEEAGLRSRDVIVAIDGQRVQSFDELLTYLTRGTQVGQTVRLTLLRDGAQRLVSVTLAARPAT
jgi:serine protease Do